MTLDIWAVILYIILMISIPLFDRWDWNRRRRKDKAYLDRWEKAGAQVTPNNLMHDIPCHCDKCEKELEDALNDPEFCRRYEEAVIKGNAALTIEDAELYEDLKNPVEEEVRDELRERKGGL